MWNVPLVSYRSFFFFFNEHDGQFASFTVFSQPPPPPPAPSIIMWRSQAICVTSASCTNAQPHTWRKQNSHSATCTHACRPQVSRIHHQMVWGAHTHEPDQHVWLPCLLSISKLFHRSRSKAVQSGEARFYYFFFYYSNLLEVFSGKERKL